VGAIVGLLVFSPVMLVAAILIKASDGGPILFRQNRVGRNGRMFAIVKFRSMLVNADAMKEELLEQNQHNDNRTFKILNDPRITAVGRVLRRLSVDELPQFWNVLRGEMSLVGPRPALPSEVALYEKRDFARLRVKPGITCIWQVSGRSNLDFQEQLKLDLEYIERQSILLDLKLLFWTLPVVVRGDGAA
jgi:lipopolysaccharide/colanic/teichoic acid biosynthesis glycosyltransferase